MPNAGQIVKALDFSASASDSQATSGTTTSTSFTSTLTGGTACSVSFVAPTSGVVLIAHDVEQLNSGANATYSSFRVGAGSTAGAGTEVLAAADARSVRTAVTAALRAGVQHRLSGLTAGSTYNVQQQFRVASGTGTFANKSLAVIPQPA